MRYAPDDRKKVEYTGFGDSGLKNKIPIDWCPIPYRHKPKIKHQINRYIFYNFIIRNILSVAPALPFTNCPALSPAASSTS